MIDLILKLATGARAAVALAALGIVGVPLFRASPYAGVKSLLGGALCADLLENLVISIAVGAFPDLGALGNALPLVTAAKFGAVIATMVSVVLLTLLWIRDRISGASRPAT